MASFLPNLTRDNISFHTIPFAWMVALAPRIYARRVYFQATSKNMDVRQPRQFSQQAADDQSVDAATRGRITRAEAAVLNGLENLPLFAAAVCAGNIAKLSPRFVNSLSVAYVLSRIVYNFAYIYNDTRLKVRGRSASFVAGIAICSLSLRHSGQGAEQGSVLIAMRREISRGTTMCDSPNWVTICSLLEC